jgi:hypothetical protein
MQGFRWSWAVGLVYGGLMLGALGVFLLLQLLGLLHFREEIAALYWLVALPFVLFFGAWLLLVVWCSIDAHRQGMNAPLWALLVFLLGFPVGPLVYLVLRQQEQPPPPDAP